MSDMVLPATLLSIGLAVIGIAVMMNALPLPYPTHVKAKKEWSEVPTPRDVNSREKKGKRTRSVTPKSVVFLDVDGTITRLPGQHPDSLFNKAEYYERAKFTDEIMRTLYEDKQKFATVKEFLHDLQNDPSCEPVIVSLNHRSVIRHILEDHFGCDAGVFLKKGFTRDDAFGSPRGGDVSTNGLGVSCPTASLACVTLNSSRNTSSQLLMTKGQFIKQFMDSALDEEDGAVNFTFFDDDQENLRSVEHLKVARNDCSKGMWLGRLLGEL